MLYLFGSITLLLSVGLDPDAKISTCFKRAEKKESWCTPGGPVVVYSPPPAPALAAAQWQTVAAVTSLETSGLRAAAAARTVAADLLM